MNDLDGKKRNSIWTNKYFGLLLITGAVYFFLRFLSPVLAPLLLAGTFLLLADPLLTFLRRKCRVSRHISALLLLILLVVPVGGLLYWCGVALCGQLGTVGCGIVDSLASGWDRICRENDFFQSLQQLTGQTELTEGAGFSSFLRDAAGKLVGQGAEYVRKVVSFVAVTLITMITVISMARDYDVIRERIEAHRELGLFFGVVRSVLQYIWVYLRSQLIIMSLVALVCSLALLAGRVEDGVFLGILAGVLDALPMIGTGIVLIPLAVFQFLTEKYLAAALCLAAYGICLLLRQWLEPKLIGKNTGVLPVFVLVAIFAGVKLFGVSGIVKGPMGLVMIREGYEAFLTAVEKRHK